MTGKETLTMLQRTLGLEDIAETWQVEIQFRDAVLGGLPLDPKVQSAWMAQLGITPEELAGEREDGVRLPSPDDEESEGTLKQLTQITGFKRDTEGPVLEPRHVRAALYHASSDAGLTKDIRGLRPAIKEGIIIRPRWIGLCRDGQRVAAPDGLHVICMSAYVPGRGRMGIIRRPEIIGGSPVCSFSMLVVAPLLRSESHLVLAHRQVTGPELLCSLMKLAGEKGIGQGRKEELGKFEVRRFEADGGPG